MSNDCLDVVLAEIEAAGLTPVVRHAGKHLKVFFGARQITVARTASDKRAVMNNRSLVRRLLRQDGFLKEKETA